MSRVLGAICGNVYGLVVDDGQLAIGIVASLAIVWVVATFAGESVRDLSGWVLLALLVALTLGNLYRAGQNARRRVAERRSSSSGDGGRPPAHQCRRQQADRAAHDEPGREPEGLRQHTDEDRPEHVP